MKRIISLLMVLVLCCTMLPSGALALDLGGAAAVGSEAAVEEPVVEEAAETPVEEANEEVGEQAAEETAAEAAEDGAVTFISGDYQYYISDGTASIDAYLGSSSSVTVPDSVYYDGVTYKVFEIRAGAFADKACIRTLVIPSGISKLGKGAFRNCTSLSSITINGDIADCNDYSSSSFWDEDYSVFYKAGLNSDSLTVTFGSGVTYIPAYLFATGNEKIEGVYARVTKLVIGSSVRTIGSYAFYNCYDLGSVSFGSSLYTIGASAFENCTGLTSLSLNSGLNSIGDYAFEGCTGLSSLSMYGGKVGNGAFRNCTSLSSITINGDIADCNDYSSSSFWDEDYSVFYKAGLNSDSLTVTFGSGVTYIPAYLFATGNEKIEGVYARVTKLVIGSSVQTIGNAAFHDCYDLKSVTFGGSLNTIVDYAFYNCTGLTSISIPKQVETIGRRAFKNCSGLTTIVMYGGKVGDGAFSNCTSLSSITINGDIADCNDDSSSSIWDDDYSVFYKAGLNSDSLTVTFGSGVTYIPAYLFATGNAKSEGVYARVTKLVIGSSVRTIGSYAFYNCYDLESLVYNGSEDDWSVVWVGDNNEWLLEADFTATVQKPATPVFSLSCVASSGKPRLTWETVSGAAKYEIWRSTSRDGTYYKQGSTTGTSYTNTGAVAGKNYYYKVRSVNTAGEYSEFSSVKSITCDCARPVVSISCVAASGKPRLSWDAVDGAVSYEVWRSTSKNGTYYKQGSTTGTGYTNTSAVAGKTYYYKVYAVGSSSYAKSAASTVKNMTCDYARPVVSISCNASTGKPKLTWSAVSGATKYEIWRSTSRTGTYTKIYTTSNTYFNNTTATANKSYYYKVRAIGSSSYATSAYSSIVSITCDCARPVVTASTNSSGKPKLTWDAVDGAVKYEIWRSGYRNGTYTKIYTTTNTYFNNTSAGSGYTYFYKVRAVGTSSYATSAYSSIVSAKCK